MTFNVSFEQSVSLKVSLSEGQALDLGFGDNVTVGTLADTYEGPYVVEPKVKSESILETKDKLMADDVTVKSVPVWETSNIKGLTVYIGRE